MAGSLLDIYGNYNQAYNRYKNLYNQESQRYTNEANKYNTALDQYLAQVDAYNAAANQYNTGLSAAQQQYQDLVNAYNATVINDPNAYNSEGNFKGQYEWGNTSPYTYYNGYTVGRTNPTSTYEAQQKEYAGSDEYGNPVTQTGWYDPSTGLGLQEGGGFNYANENAYLNPQTGLVSLFTSRPGEFSYGGFNQAAPGTFDLAQPVFNEPTAPNAPPPSEVTTTANIKPEELYQQQFGRPTADVMSNEAWSLANLSSPFMSSEPSTAYETGGVNAMNNPLSYVGPDALTTGQTNIDQNSQIYGQNPYY